MSISDSTLSTDMWNDVRSLIVAAGITTTSAQGSTSSINIAASYPLKNVSKPSIIIFPVSVDENDWKFGGTYGKQLVNVVCELSASEPGMVDQMSNQLRVAMSANSLSGMNLISSHEDVAFNSPGDNPVHMKTITYVFMRESHA